MFVVDMTEKDMMEIKHLGKLGTFHCVRPVSSWRLLVPLLFLLIPLTIALSRTADYHHHWQDVLVGSMLGFSIIWMVYRQVKATSTALTHHCIMLHASYFFAALSPSELP